ncbi:MAG: endonuclease V [Planctomycetaceae bacterium]|nr:endonuclease V [Planctomycetaceae bacterium]
MVEIPDLPAWLNQFLRRIPSGKVMTYGDVARLMGDVSAARYVAEYGRRHEHTSDCPCHRLVRKTGELGQYVTGDVQEKSVRLQSEGVIFADGKVDLDRSGWQPEPNGLPGPLSGLLAYQDRISEAVQECALKNNINRVAGVDLAYPEKGIGQAACVILNAETLEIENELIRREPVPFPYIPRYLAFRELPLLLSLWEELLQQGEEPDLIFVDGNGLLHPRRAGIASCLGVEINKPTIGISKSLLCGTVPEGSDQERPVLYHDQTIGMAITSHRSSKPFYVSVGHQITLSEAVRWMFRSWKQAEHRLPEPIFQADRLSRK